MRTLSRALLLGLALSSPPLVASGQKEVLLGTCNRYPAFRVEDVRRKVFGPELYDLVFYELNYRQVDRMLLLFLDDFGKVTYEREFEREAPRQLRFEISARVGDEHTIARDVQRYLKANEINGCKAQ